ncbi:WecB/TagA/CpsF family glycosyltransferase [Rhizobium straminoryzae]|uniref:WecB/TagA/CpsF family glycosyltransferase n=1 Tax=Rhizobium straminoryzae TaxID=1387186 RepID=A0A549T7F0_9HYPH|nr:WecB/TagA/CpsF family glycosyltransferase [Rhizobium straminoryzae]TRL37776.1 WecB/TagA/CpsF family glycosyltransferase [Rhizobium straminoryzae]
MTMIKLSPKALPVSDPRKDKDDKTATLFGIRFSTADTDGLVDTLAEEAVPRGAGLRLLVTANVDHIVNLRRNERFREAYRFAWRAVIDGTPVFLYARLRGLALPGKVTGSDLFPRLIARLEPGVHRILLVSPTEDTSRRLYERLQQMGFTDHIVMTAPPAFEDDKRFARWLIAAARRQQTTHLILGLGAPKSEIWMHEHARQLPDCYGMALGAALEFYAGTKQRAPVFMRRAGIEFLWRVICEPRRLARRYFVSSWSFFRAIAEDLRGKTLPRP